MKTLAKADAVCGVPGAARQTKDPGAAAQPLRARANVRPHRNKEALVWIFASVAGLAATWCVYHYPFDSGFDLFPGPRGDTRLSAYLIEHGYQALTGRADWLSPAIFYPAKGTLGFSDAYLAYLPLYSMLRSAGCDIFLALSLTVIVFSFANYLACFALLRRALGLGAIASCAGAMFFAFNSPKLAQSDHLQLQPVFLLPIIVALVVSCAAGAKLRAQAAFGLLAAAALCVNLQLLTSFYIGWFFLLWCLLFAALSSCFLPTRNFVRTVLGRQPKAVIGAAIVFTATLAPFLMIYLPAASSVPAYGVLPQYIPELKSYLLMADGNYVWHGFTQLLLRQTGGGADWGRRIGIGLLPSIAWVALSVFALRVLWRAARRPVETDEEGDQRQTRTGWLFLAVMIIASNILVVIGLQYHGHSLWNYAYVFLPGAKAIRAVARYVIVLTLPMSIAFAFLVQRGMGTLSAMKSPSRRWSGAALIFAAAALGLFEQWSSGAGQYFSISAENARLQRLAAGLPAGCASFYVVRSIKLAPKRNAFDDQQSMHDAMLISAMLHVPTLNGRSGKVPNHWALRDIDAADYEQNVSRWIGENNLTRVCRLEIDA